jgi:hypothetical protein
LKTSDFDAGNGTVYIQNPFFKFGVKSPTGSLLHDFTTGTGGADLRLEIGGY